MWRRLHILSPLQSFVVASVSAASIAVPLAVQSIPRGETALIRNLFWPDTLTPYITFSLVFIGVVPVLLGYYHLGRLGFMVTAAAGFAMAWVMAVCAMLCFTVVGYYFGSVVVGGATYAVFVVTVCILLAWFHLRAASSLSIRDAQRKLRLVPIEASYLS